MNLAQTVLLRSSLIWVQSVCTVCYLRTKRDEMACADPESFVKVGPTLTLLFFFLCFFFSWWGQITLKAGHHRPTSDTPFKWRFAGGPVVAQHWMLGLVALWFSRGSGPVLLKNPIALWFSRGSPPLWIRAWDSMRVKCTHFVKKQNMDSYSLVLRYGFPVWGRCRRPVRDWMAGMRPQCVLKSYLDDIIGFTSYMCTVQYKYQVNVWSHHIK